jgi:hypothetical protein
MMELGLVWIRVMGLMESRRRSQSNGRVEMFKLQSYNIYSTVRPLSQFLCICTIYGFKSNMHLIDMIFWIGCASSMSNVARN